MFKKVREFHLTVSLKARSYLMSHWYKRIGTACGLFLAEFIDLVD
jgi:hypothetical protein